MRVDLESSSVPLESLPRFQLAAIHSRRLLRCGIPLAIFSLAMLFSGMVTALFSRDTIWLSIQINIGAALILLVTALQSAYRVASWRAQTFSVYSKTRPLDVASHDDPLPSGEPPKQENNTESPNLVRQFFSRFHEERIKPIKEAIPKDVIWIIIIASMVLSLINSVWRLDLPATPINKFAYLLVGFILLIVFVLLVAERYLTNNKDEWPEAGHLAMQTRAAMITLIVSAICLCYANSTSVWPTRLAVLISLLPCLLAVELVIRAVLSIFTPSRPTLEPKLVAVSFFAELLRWPPRPVQLLQNSLQQGFGIDLRQVWAFRFIRRALYPVVGLILLTGWLLTCINEIPVNGRGIYEKFGKPVAVLSSGLQVGLPWPFGQVIPVENGVVHEIASTSKDATQVTPNKPEVLSSAEGPAPNSANRLWDVTHNNEKSQIIASGSKDKQSFQIVDMDVRFVYRIGLDDQSALNATYNSIDLPTLIRRIASRVLVHDFAGRTLDDLLSAQRTALAEDIHRAVQKDLDHLHSGVELLATVVEAIHPPAKAANAYHKVQAAQIGVQALIAREKGKAAALMNDAQRQASQINHKAQANVHDTLSQALATKIQFTAEKTAATQAGHTFLREQYYDLLSSGMKNARSLIIDNKITSDHPPTIDFRRFVAPVDSINKANSH